MKAIKPVAIILAMALSGCVCHFCEKNISKENFDIGRYLLSENTIKFEKDPLVLGTWRSVDFVSNPDDFSPDRQQWQGELYLKQIVFRENWMTDKPFMIWTKGKLIHFGDESISHYKIKKIDGSTYMFLEWISGDVLIRGQKPKYYVLEKNT